MGIRCTSNVICFWCEWAIRYPCYSSIYAILPIYQQSYFIPFCGNVLGYPAQENSVCQWQTVLLLWFVKKGRQGTRMIARVVLQQIALVAKRPVGLNTGRGYKTVVRAIHRHLVSPSDARLSLENGKTITMMDLKRGDRVKTGKLNILKYIY